MQAQRGGGGVSRFNWVVGREGLEGWFNSGLGMLVFEETMNASG